MHLLQFNGKFWQTVGVLIFSMITHQSNSAELFTIVEHSELSQTKESTVRHSDENGSVTPRTEKTTQLVVINTSSLQEESLIISSVKTSDTLINGNDNPVYVRETAHRSPTGFTVWRGVSETNPLETATILQKNGEFHGTIHSSGKTFSLRPSGQTGKHLLIEKDFTGMGCGNEGE